jgi:hypothetical protein
MDSFERLLSLVTTEDKAKARSFLKRPALSLVFALTDDVSALDLEAIAEEYNVQPDTVRDWFEKAKATGRYRPKRR